MVLRLRSITVAALATISNASPLVYPRDGSSSNISYAFTNSNGLNFTQMNTSLPNVTIFATGIRLLPLESLALRKLTPT